MRTAIDASVLWCILKQESGWQRWESALLDAQQNSDLIICDVALAEISPYFDDAAGCPVWHGSEADLGILEAAYLHTSAAMRNCTIPSDLFGELIRVDDLIVTPHQFSREADGVYLHVPQMPGLGVELNRKGLKHHLV